MNRSGHDQTTTSRKRKRVDVNRSSADMPSSASSQRGQIPAADQDQSNPDYADNATVNNDKDHEPAATSAVNDNATTKRDPDKIPPWLPPLGFSEKIDLLLLRSIVFKMLRTVGIDRDELNIRHMCTGAYESVLAIENSSYGERHPLLPQWRQVFTRLADHRVKDLLIIEEQMLSILPYYHPRRQSRRWSLTPPPLVPADTATSLTATGQGSGAPDFTEGEDRMDVDMQ
ncbi:hypothetical protein LTR70_004945 [Exophiala xenobiotica]|uniref:Uncharacterized protein n=1 Tax=Lithohypha guttulata TaxID=1690604 RepID=A0ABR0KC12_9EURO|nr:hypothetical protein LTR24_004523 [Lithohypha guttulata]KAK5319761.1 hypothetical protein LTR70_004945 [Exophiala xenobiotica]